MKSIKWLLLAVAVAVVGDYFVMKSYIADYGKSVAEDVMAAIADSNPGVTCLDVESYGSSLPLQYLYATEYEATAYLSTPPNVAGQVKSLSIPVRLTTTNAPVLRVFTNSLVSVNRNEVVQRLIDKGFCK